MKFRVFLIAFCSAVLLWAVPVSSPNAETVFRIKGIDQKIFDRLSINTDQPIELLAADLLHALEQRGYILATVDLTDDGILNVDLGRINKITVMGLDSKSELRARGYLETATGEKPNVKNIDRALALINDLPGISASIAFERSPTDGAYELVLAADQRRQFGGVSLDSTPRNLFKQNRINLQQDFYSVLTGGDIVRLQGAYIRGDDKPAQRSVYGSYQIPVGKDGFYLEGSVGDLKSETSVVGTSTTAITSSGVTIIPGAVSNHDFEGQTASLTAGYPLVRTHNSALYIVSALNYSDDTTDSLGDAESILGSISVFHNHHSATGESIAAGISLSYGSVDDFINTKDGNFGHLRVGAGYIQPVHAISQNTEIRLEGYGQIGSTKTPASSGFNLGSEEFLRGYSTATFSGNSGLAATAELAHAYHPTIDYIHRLTPYIFIDVGYIENASSQVNATTRPENDTLVSFGLGATANFENNLQLLGYFGIPVMEDASNKVPGPRPYLKLSWSW